MSRLPIAGGASEADQFSAVVLRLPQELVEVAGRRESSVKRRDPLKGLAGRQNSMESFAMREVYLLAIGESDILVRKLYIIIYLSHILNLCHADYIWCI